MRTAFTTILVIVALLAIGCSDSQRLEDQLAAANSRSAELDSLLTETQSQLTAVTAQADDLRLSLADVREERDGLSSKLESVQSQVAALRADLRNARNTHRSEADSLTAVAESVKMDLRTCQTELASAESRITASERRINTLVNSRDSLYAFVDEVRPWYEYYRHEAQRNWLKKLFGAGDAQSPEIPEPTFGNNAPAMELEAVRP